MSEALKKDPAPAAPQRTTVPEGALAAPQRTTAPEGAPAEPQRTTAPEGAPAEPQRTTAPEGAPAARKKAPYEKNPHHERRMETYHTNSEEETLALGKRIASQAAAGDVFLLTGDLGSGKTVFARGFAGALGVTGHVTSPTFTIMQAYEDGRIPFYHFDIYRISDIMELYDIGFDEYIGGDGICVIEWGEMIKDLLPPGTKQVTFHRDLKGEDNARTITVE